MKLPNEIQIGSRHYKVLSQERVQSETEVLWGKIVHDLGQIVIDEKLDGNEALRTEVLFHEILHGICEVWGVNCDEYPIRALASGILDTVRRNGLDLLNEDLV